MNHPLAPNLRGLKDEELQTKYNDLLKRYNQAYRFGPVSIIPQLQMLLGDYQEELNRRNQVLMDELSEKLDKQNGGKGIKGIIDIK
jgi:hypothetical protein